MTAPFVTQESRTPIQVPGPNPFDGDYDQKLTRRFGPRPAGQLWERIEERAEAIENARAEEDHMHRRESVSR